MGMPQMDSGWQDRFIMSTSNTTGTPAPPGPARDVPSQVHGPGPSSILNPSPDLNSSSSAVATEPHLSPRTTRGRPGTKSRATRGIQAPNSPTSTGFRLPAISANMLETASSSASACASFAPGPAGDSQLHQLHHLQHEEQHPQQQHILPPLSNPVVAELSSSSIPSFTPLQLGSMPGESSSEIKLRRTRKSYTREYKLKALSLLKDERRDAKGNMVPASDSWVAKQVGVTRKVLRGWKAQEERLLASRIGSRRVQRQKKASTEDDTTDHANTGREENSADAEEHGQEMHEQGEEDDEMRSSMTPPPPPGENTRQQQQPPQILPSVGAAGAANMELVRIKTEDGARTSAGFSTRGKPDEEERGEAEVKRPRIEGSGSGGAGVKA